MKPGCSVEIVIPTIGRSSLTTLLRALDDAARPSWTRVIVVDDRRDQSAPLDVPQSVADTPVEIVATAGGRGPATARNAGWRSGFSSAR